MVCEILVALQGRVDAARLFGDRLEQIIFKLGGTRSTWDPKVYLFHFGPLVNTSATLGEVLTACKASEHSRAHHHSPKVRKRWGCTLLRMPPPTMPHAVSLAA